MWKHKSPSLKLLKRTRTLMNELATALFFSHSKLIVRNKISNIVNLTIFIWIFLNVDVECRRQKFNSSLFIVLGKKMFLKFVNAVLFCHLYLTVKKIWLGSEFIEQDYAVLKKWEVFFFGSALNALLLIRTHWIVAGTEYRSIFSLFLNTVMMLRTIQKTF